MDIEFWKRRNDRFWAEYPFGEGLIANAFYPWNSTQSRAGIVKGNKTWRKISEWLSCPENRMSSFLPFSKSGCRNGISAWDRAIAVPRTTESVLPVGSASSSMANTDWDSILECMNDVKPGLCGKRPSGKFVWDLLGMDRSWELANLAHVLTHKASSCKAERFRYSQTSNVFAAYLFKVCMAVKYGLVIDTEPHMPATESLDSLDRRGIRIHMSRQFRNPRIDMPCIGPESPLIDRDVAYVCASAHFEPQPNPDIVESGGWLEMNRWSCVPTVFCFAGWSTVDWITHSQLVRFRTRKDLYWEMPAGSLDPPSMFDDLIEDASSDESDGKRYFRVYEYLDSRSYQVSRACCHPLPCRCCMKVNQRVENCPVRPEGKPEQTRQWLDYEAGMEKIYSACREASKFFDSLSVGMKKASGERRKMESLSSKAEKLIKQAERLGKMAAIKMDNGFVSESRAMLRKKKEILGKIDKEACEFADKVISERNSKKRTGGSEK